MQAYLFAYGKLEVTTKNLMEQLESVSRENHLFAKGLITFYSKEDETIKQNLRIKKFYGETENAVKIQIWIVLIVIYNRS